MTDPIDRFMVETAERFADGTIADEDRTSARRRATRHHTRMSGGTDRVISCRLAALDAADTLGVRAAADASLHARYARANGITVQREDVATQVSFLRDIFGSPFRPVAVDPEWLTSTVTQLARGIYEDRAFDRMPILADALQDAGCDNSDILTHCRDESITHVRGCWVVDHVLGKS